MGDALELWLRIATVITLAVAAGMMFRYYLSQPRMPRAAFAGYACYTVALLGTVVYKISTPGQFRWWLTPFALAGAVAVIIGVTPRLQWRHKR